MKTSAVIKIISKFSALHREEIRKIMAKDGLYFGQHPILWALLNQEASTQIELARHLGVSAASVNNSIRRLSENGFLVKEADETDQRKSRIYLTDKGRDAAIRCGAEFRQLDKKMFAGITDEELEALYSLFDRMIQNTKQS